LGLAMSPLRAADEAAGGVWKEGAFEEIFQKLTTMRLVGAWR